MNRSVFALVAVLSVVAGCSSDKDAYRNQPLVARVETGMTKEQVRQIGGQPLLESDRTVEPGSCFDYMLVQAGMQQPYYVSFDMAETVDRTGFMTCAQWSNAQQKSREAPSSMGGMGGSGY
ncbi:osmotically-inducible lipoprotein OsmE [Pseudomonas sp. BJa5]|uniref:osmotically-inducible lipoprotein OsmE n=1 Tax=Pseudomonas sp. BJa5 TaxID=2936270 RepID=UPI00255A33AC|nr:osmotically-inducible lipoprotein OsmE [Pseudomonas sp. BGr12]MDL2424170.1 osmotically-inducible lipoprotein OsmE [Pseudomonas sp. BGr12]